MAGGPTLSLHLSGLHFGPEAPPLFGPLMLDVASGEVVALIGPSGVGKTTLLRMIGGLERRFTGQILIDGCAPDMAPPPGFVFQDTRLLPWLSVAANLRAVRPMMTPPEVDALLGRLGLAGQAGAYPRQLSGGMQRRLGLARAICVNPGLLLLDEPFVSLDRAAVQDLRAVALSVLRANRPTAVLVSHDPEDAAHLADRVVILGARPASIVADLRLNPVAAQRGPAEIADLVALIQAAQPVITTEGR